MIGLINLQNEVGTLALGAALTLPSAAMEQHGLHVPLATAISPADGIARVAAVLAGGVASACLAPTLAFGSSHHKVVTALSLRSLPWPVDPDCLRPLSYRGLLDGALVRHGEWAWIDGYSDAVIAASCALGGALPEVIADAASASSPALARSATNAAPTLAPS